VYAAVIKLEMPLELKKPFACGDAVRAVPGHWIDVNLGVDLKYPVVKSQVD
jgi:hypothetical protein